MTKKFHLLTPIVGGLACGAKCRFCVAHMTPVNGVSLKAIEPNWAAYRKACQYTRERGADSVLLTSKGEPCNWPDLITRYLEETHAFGFPTVELQTNGIRIADRKPVTDEHLRAWRRFGLGLIAISITHYDPEKNRITYMGEGGKPYIDLPRLISDLHGFGFSVRLACVMHKGQIDSVEELKALMDYARENRVEQLTVRPVNRPSVTHDKDGTSDWTGRHFLSDETKAAMRAYLESAGTIEQRFSWGGIVFDVGGQNVCFTNSLTADEPGIDLGRQLIFTPEGKVTDDWQTEGRWLHEFDCAVPAPAGSSELVKLEVTGDAGRAKASLEGGGMNDFSVTGFHPMKAVYTYMYPETFRIVAETTAALSLELFQVTTSQARAGEILSRLFDPPLHAPATALGNLDLDEMHGPIIERIVAAYADQLPALSGFGSRYPGAGSSTGLFHLLTRLRVQGVRHINVLRGEYEGYAAQAANLGMQTRQYDIDDRRIKRLKPGYWFISNPSARDGNTLPQSFIDELCRLGHKLVLDLSYVGATRPQVFDISHENIFAALLSFSKPYGVFRLRMGGFIFTREPVPSLYGSKWFKDVVRLWQSLRLAEQIGPSGLYARYRPVQEKVVAALNAKYGLGLNLSDVILLANLKAAEAERLDDEQKALIAQFKRESYFRFCLTPYFEEAQRQGLVG